ncbi:MAG: membrane protein insertase YidC [bacterium]|nr:membrane protein insertase YidC [bacterium]
MDRKVLFQAILWAVSAYLIFQIIVFRLYPPTEAPDTPGQATSQPAGSDGSPPALATHAPRAADREPGRATAEEAAGVFTVRGASEQTTLVLGSTAEGEQGPFRAEIHLTNAGAAIDSVLLADHLAEVDGEEHYRLVGPVELAGKTLRSLAYESILVDDEAVALDELLWNAREVEESAAQSAIFECELLREDQPTLRLTRRYTLEPTPLSDRRYDLHSELTIENLTDEGHEVRLTMRGPVGIQQEDRRLDDRSLNVGLFLEGQVQARKATTAAEVGGTTGGLIKLFDPQEPGRFWWLAAENKYFAFVTTPVDEHGAEDAKHVLQATAVDLDGRTETPENVVTRLVLGNLTVVAGGSTTVHAHHYIGPKSKLGFLDERNADYGRRNYYMLNLDRLASCTFSWLAELMVTLLNSFHAVVRNYGVAIFLLVLLVRVLLHPVTKRTQVNMVKMQQAMGQLQPKLEDVKKRYANDKQRLQQETMRIYKEEGVNPAGQMLSCLPMLLQMPIWVALWSSLNNNVAMRHEGFVWWIRDLSAPDQLWEFGSGFSFPLVGDITALNLLPLLVGVTMYAQQKLMPKPKPPSTEQTGQAAQMQKQMQAMMPLMSVFMVLIFYNMPSGLNLYIMTSSILGALEQWRIRKHVEEEKDRLATTVPVESSAKPVVAKTPRSPSFLERLAKKADDAQKLRSRRK